MLGISPENKWIGPQPNFEGAPISGKSKNWSKSMKLSQARDNSKSRDLGKGFAFRDGNPFFLFFSLILTPLILFISSSNMLYLKNQVDFGYNYAVLYPFALLFAISVVLGHGLHFFSDSVIVKHLLIFYYLGGPFFLFYTSLRNIPVVFLETGWGLLFSLLAFAAVLAVVIRNVSLRPMINLFALVGFLFLLIETHSMLTQFQTFQFNDNHHIGMQEQDLEDDKKAPNIYILLFYN